MRPNLPLPLLLLLATGVCAQSGCPKVVRPSVSAETVPQAEYVPAPPCVFDAFADLGPATFGHLSWGADAGAVATALELDRYHVQEASWGLPGAQVQVVEVRDARLASTTAFLFDGERRDLRTILIRDLPAPPPPQVELRGFLPFLEAFPGKIAVLGYPEEDGTHAQPYRFLLFDGLGVKIGVSRESDSLWYLDHVEYFDPEWGMEELAAFKYGGQLVAFDTIGNAERRQAVQP